MPKDSAVNALSAGGADRAMKRLAEQWQRGTFPGLQSWAESKPPVACFRGVGGSSDAFLISDLLATTQRTVFALVENTRRAETLAAECRSLVGAESVSLFPSRDAVPYNMKSPFGPTEEARLRVVAALLEGSSGIFIAPAASLPQRVLPAKDLFNSIIRLEVGGEIGIDTLSAWLVENGFRKEQLVSDLGTFSVRGGIFDIYPFMTEHPVRLEFWGNVVESIREFDVFSQKSVTDRRRVDIYPMKEFCLGEDVVKQGVDALRKHCDSGKGDPMALQRLEHQWLSLGDLEGIEWFLHWFPVPSTSFLDYLPDSTIVVWDDMMPAASRLDETVANYLRHLQRVPQMFQPLVSPPDSLLIPLESLHEEMNRFQQVFIETKGVLGEVSETVCSIAEQPSLPPQVDALISDLQQHHREGYDTVVVSPNLGNAERLWELLEEACPFVKVVVGALQRGFIDRAGKSLWYSEAQFFRRRFRPVRQTRPKGGAPIHNFDALSLGDYVVHVDHGIGEFMGVQRIEADDSQRDCMVLRFEQRARLYVPVEDFHKVQKYVTKESAAPSLSRLGSSSWERTKKRTRQSLREMAKELIELYATRQHLEGITFSKDALWQQEFEDAFVYEETPDQEKAIGDVKSDMESPKPMDRLVCGDVGFGKTEVAMRAAFKAVMDGYQVAVLAPTTILAVQHHATFSERMANFPVRVEVLCRFLKPKEEKVVLEKAASGGVDIVVGTHRLLSKDVGFKNLGLLVVDEEQKFGVRHKEKLKQLRAKIDVLSMTATPIPRTLHMSLIGARDLSMMNTPPENRLPVQTVVAEYHDEMVGNAIEHELDRGGQVYVVHNRVKNLHVIQDRIEQLVPRARVVSAHGQMPERELESVMRQFVAGRFDVLVSTVIIENGLDITNVNTVIVNRADAMGLAQLYQLRGRVGRSSEQAYAYLLTPPFRQVDETSLRRLHALEQYTDLGSGFQIAMRDLEIRGAGDILGTRQHGFIAAVGFDMYCRLLQEAVREVRGEKVEDEEPDVKIEIPLEVFIPPEYVSDSAGRVTIYQELSSVADAAGIKEIERGLVDRFGPLPAPVQNLLLLMRVKAAARKLGCSKVRITPERELLLTYEGETETIKDRIARVIKDAPRVFEVMYDTPVSLKTPLSDEDPLELALETREILESTAG